MEDIKKEIIDIILKYQEDEKSSTGTTGESVIYAESTESIADEVVNLIQLIFDPENQPNQLGIENPFSDKNYCMPDDINSKEEHDEYLKAIDNSSLILKKEHQRIWAELTKHNEDPASIDLDEMHKFIFDK